MLFPAEVPNTAPYEENWLYSSQNQHIMQVKEQSSRKQQMQMEK